MTQFPLGAEVTVFYDPGAPAEAVLVPDSWRGQETLEFWLAVLVASGFGFVLFVWQLRRSSEADAKIGDVTGDATGDPPAAPPQV